MSKKCFETLRIFLTRNKANIGTCCSISLSSWLGNMFWRFPWLQVAKQAAMVNWAFLTSPRSPIHLRPCLRNLIELIYRKSGENHTRLPRCPSLLHQSARCRTEPDQSLSTLFQRTGCRLAARSSRGFSNGSPLPPRPKESHASAFTA